MIGNETKGHQPNRKSPQPRKGRSQGQQRQHQWANQRLLDKRTCKHRVWGKFRTTGERRDTHIVERYNERERAVSQTREHAEAGMEGDTDTWLKRGVSSGMGDKKGKIYLTPGEESRKDATKVTDSQLSLYSKWMEPWGKRAAWLALTSLKMNLAPSSRIIPVIRDPLVT